MRLKLKEITAIKAAANEVFGPDAVVRRFGSRVRDDLKGGDIDLHVEADAVHDPSRTRNRFLDRLFETIEPQKVDVVISVRGATPRGFERVAYRDGTVL